jgi:hypothetical protein
MSFHVAIVILNGTCSVRVIHNNLRGVISIMTVKADFNTCTPIQS